MTNSNRVTYQIWAVEDVVRREFKSNAALLGIDAGEYLGRLVELHRVMLREHPSTTLLKGVLHSVGLAPVREG